MHHIRLQLRSCFVFTVVLASAGFVNASEKDNAEIKQGYDAAKNAPLTKVPHKLTTFACDTHKFAILPPVDFELQELTPGFGKVFMFRGKKHTNGKAPVLDVSVIVPPPADPLPPNRVIVDSALAPFKAHLTDYVRKDMPKFKQNGLEFEGASFTGKAADNSKVQGVVRVTNHKGAFFSIFAQDEAATFDSANKLFIESFQSFKAID